MSISKSDRQRALISRTFDKNKDKRRTKAKLPSQKSSTSAAFNADNERKLRIGLSRWALHKSNSDIFRPPQPQPQEEKQIQEQKRKKKEDTHTHTKTNKNKNKNINTKPKPEPKNEHKIKNRNNHSYKNNTKRHETKLAERNQRTAALLVPLTETLPVKMRALLSP